MYIYNARNINFLLLQVQLPLFEELISRSSRLQSSLSTLVSVFSGFLETAEKICYHAVESKSDPELGVCLERIVARHRNMELVLKTLARFDQKIKDQGYE